MHDEHVHGHDHEAQHACGIAHAHDHSHLSEEEHEALHAAGIPHAHGHTHTHENTKAVLNRLSRAIGHLQSVKRMVEEGRDCSEVLVQIAAVRSAIDNTGKVILQDHLKHCIVDAAREGDQQAIDDLCAAIEKYMK
ncbi:MAG: metal-sensing transcriptional repressor [Candidatus Faecivicinus sp.]